MNEYIIKYKIFSMLFLSWPYICFKSFLKKKYSWGTCLAQSVETLTLISGL